ncbi:uncharacterized protein LOC110033052 [Phalaenopsis equestris]|uniref:uncharacterized protein LOC110033052 n=1 Tax=Phalaenopsis equestris TaxID=78828 RepID=UPI0009E28717|nr:uncharacterized protein LOC110033052 [Phalaenopsis equestris]
MFGGVIAIGKYACTPSETEFCVAPENVDVNLSCDSTDLQSLELPEIQSTSRFKRPRVEGRKKSGAAFIKNQISHLVDTSNDAPRIVQGNSIKQVVKIMDEDEEISEKFELYFFAVELLQDSVQRDFFTAIPKKNGWHFYDIFMLTGILEEIFCLIFY